jgi:hypothetical protein
VPELLLLLPTELLVLLPEQPPAIKPAAITSTAPATRWRAPILLASLLMTHAPRSHVLDQLSHHGGMADLARGRGGTTHTAS